MILAVMNAIFAIASVKKPEIAKIAFISATVIASLDFISAVQYMVHFIYHIHGNYETFAQTVLWSILKSLFVAL